MNKMLMVLIAATAITSAPASAQSRCPAGDMGCTSENYDRKITKRIEQGKREVFNASGVRGRVDAVKNTLRDCADCATKVITDSVEKIKPNR